MLAYKYKHIKGLVGPTTFPGGWVLYYDPKINSWYDSTTDLYVSDQEVEQLKVRLFDLIRGEHTS